MDASEAPAKDTCQQTGDDHSRKKDGAQVLTSEAGHFQAVTSRLTNVTAAAAPNTDR